MNKETAVKTMLEAMNGFHGRFKRIYGQVAMRIDDDTYLTSGSNKLLSGIIEDDLEICDINSGDIAAIFRKRPDVNAFIFGCSPDTVTVANELDSLPVALEDSAQLSGPFIPIANDAKPHSILACLRNSDICLVKGIGAIAVSEDMRGVVASLHILHKSCEAYIHGKMLGGFKPLSTEIATWLKATYVNQYLDTNDQSHVDYVGFDEDIFKLRSQVIDFGKELIHEDLVYGKAGNLSMKINDNEMLISPSSMDYFDIGIEDIVQVNLETLDHGKQRVPSSDAELHANMYNNLPGCSAIIHTHSNACSVFAACEAGFTIADPDLQRLIGDIKVAPYIPEDPEAAMNALMETLATTHAVILPHHGAIFYGPSLDVVFEIAKAVEMLARNILNFDAKADEIENENNQD